MGDKTKIIMDAVKFIKGKNRICKSVKDCCKCPIYIEGYKKRVSCDVLISEYTEEAVKIVEKWLTEHMITRQSEFLKAFPHAKRLAEGTIDICPKLIDDRFDDCDLYRTCKSCNSCKKDYWCKEVETDE